MTATEFPQYDAKVAAGMQGSAAAAGGLATFLAIEHVDLGAGSLHARVGVGQRRHGRLPVVDADQGVDDGPFEDGVGAAAEGFE